MDSISASSADTPILDRSAKFDCDHCQSIFNLLHPEELDCTHILPPDLHILVKCTLLPSLLLITGNTGITVFLFFNKALVCIQIIIFIFWAWHIFSGWLSAAADAHSSFGTIEKRHCQCKNVSLWQFL